MQEESLETAHRNRRNMLLHGTDWWAASDRTMTAAQTTYTNNSSARIVFDITYETDDA